MVAQFWEAKADGSVVCTLCGHTCKIKRNDKGRCGMRANMRGELVSLVENIITAPNIDPVEKKPLYHFLPGAKTFSFGSVGCNFSCKFCQNYDIACLPSQQGTVAGKRINVQDLFQFTIKQNVPLVAFTYNEPTISFELIYALTGMLQSSEMRSILVTNGFMSDSCLLALRRRIAAANVDLKSFKDSFYQKICGGRLKLVLDNLKMIRNNFDWWLEITTLLIPGLNDTDAEIKDMAHFIRDELGPDTPWHLSAFHPAYQMENHPATPQDVLERCWSTAKTEGLNHVYIGNTTQSIGTSTVCPKCGMLCIERRPGYKTKINWTERGECPQCHTTIPGIWS